MNNKEVNKCLVCAMQATHNFKDCISQICDCGCLREIYTKKLTAKELPSWFVNVSHRNVGKNKYLQLESELKKGN